MYIAFAKIRCGVGSSVGVFGRMNRNRYLSTSHSPKGRVEKVAGGESEFVFLSSFEAQRG
jgi:hypothetical protein